MSPTSTNTTTNNNNTLGGSSSQQPSTATATPTMMVSVVSPVQRSTRLALLEGLLAHPAQGRAIVQEALRHDEAAGTVERFWKRCGDQRRSMREPVAKRRKVGGEDGSVTAPNSASNNSSTSSDRILTGEHWLWKSLRAYSRVERKAALSLLLHQCQEDAHTAHRCLRPLLRLVNRYLIAGSSTRTSPPGSPRRNMGVLEPNIGALDQLAAEWVAVLQHQYPTPVLMRFWTLWTSALWQCAIQQPRPVAVCHLAHLCYTLTIQIATTTAENNPYALRQLQAANRLCLWNSNSVSHSSVPEELTTAMNTPTLSPLACLIGALHAMQRVNKWWCAYETKAAKEAAHLLSHLLDPTVQPTIAESAAPPVTNTLAATATSISSPRRTLRTTTRTVTMTTNTDSTTTNANAARSSTTTAAAGWVEGYDTDDTVAQADNGPDDHEDDDVSFKAWTGVDEEVEHEEAEEEEEENPMATNVNNNATTSSGNSNSNTDPATKKASDIRLGAGIDHKDQNNRQDDNDDEDDADHEDEEDEEEHDHHHNHDEGEDEPEEDDEDVESMEHEQAQPHGIAVEMDEDDEDDEHVDEDEDDDDDDDIVVNGEELPCVIERTFGLDGDDAAVAMDLDELTAVVRDSQQQHSSRTRRPVLNQKTSAVTPPTSVLSPPLAERQRLYVMASMQVLGVHYPHTHQSSHGPMRKNFLDLGAETALIKSINKIIKPPKKPLTTKIIMRRAPTQEEFFRGSLSQNPIPIAALKPDSQSDSYDPTVADLRQHIANDLQMPDSAELIEILVANKILDVNLKLRVVHHVLWRKHLMEHPSAGLVSYLTSSSASSSAFFSRGTGLSIFFSSDTAGGGEDGDRRAAVTEDTPASSLPSLLATYRLAGVDGEATEDTVHVEDLVDPEAPPIAKAGAASYLEVEKRLESEYGITSWVTDGRGVYVLLRSVQHVIMDLVRRIRRDDVGCTGENPSRASFRQSPPCQALILLHHCTKLPRNRKRLLQARAPTILLTLLLEVLKSLEVTNCSTIESSAGSNPTAELLQELIESLASDISTSTTTTESVQEGYESDMAQDAASMPLLLESIETISLSKPLRSIIAKLLPFLTYGQVDLSRELALHFDRNISLETLADCEAMEELSSLPGSKNESILMQTFIDTAVSLPANDICNSLRLELIHCGFVDRLAHFAMQDMPKHPPTWSPALWLEGELVALSSKMDQTIKDGWRQYFHRRGLATTFKILTGLCKKHAPTQECIAQFPEFLQSCHWMESTSDHTVATITTGGLGLLAEMLLDEATEGNPKVSAMVEDLRKRTNLRKKNIAQQKRKEALLKMHSLGAPGGFSLADVGDPARGSMNQSSVRDAAASILAPVLGLFRDSNTSTTAQSAGASAGATATKSKANNKKKQTAEPVKPAWLAEAESMVEETGLKCAVCQEGRTLQPKELLGLYAYSKKISIPTSKNLTRGGIDGTDLLKALPSKLPESLVEDPFAEDWFLQALEAQSAVAASPDSSSSTVSRRNAMFITTVSAGNAIHITCHRRARQADRNHPKAPKSEWEGASLRNNRVTCNMILPLVSSQSSSVPLMHINSGLSDYQSAVTNLLGSSPPSMLWPVLHDVRFLLLRMAYGESLNADCGGGSLHSNCQMLFYQLHLAEMFDRDAQADQRTESQHARGLSAGCLLACSLLFTREGKMNTTELAKGVADAAAMACLTSIVFHNMKACGNSKNVATNIDLDKPHPKREWLVGRELFLRGLLVCAGRRHVLNLNNSGCQNSRGLSGRKRSSSFADWETTEVDANDEDRDAREKKARRRGTRTGNRSTSPTVEDFQNAFRPMITLFAILDQLSSEFTPNMDDVQIEESAQRMVHVIENCQRSRSIHELIRKAKVPLDNGQMMDLLQRGMVLG